MNMNVFLQREESRRMMARFNVILDVKPQQPQQQVQHVQLPGDQQSDQQGWQDQQNQQQEVQLKWEPQGEKKQFSGLMFKPSGKYNNIHIYIQSRNSK